MKSQENPFKILISEKKRLPGYALFYLFLGYFSFVKFNGSALFDENACNANDYGFCGNGRLYFKWALCTII